MKVTVLNKEYDLPEEIVKRLHINSSWEEKRVKNGPLWRSICVIDDSALHVLEKWLNDTKWRISVQLDAYTTIKGYAKEAKEKKHALSKEYREVESFLVDMYIKSGDEKLKFIKSLYKIAIFQANDDSESTVIYEDESYKKKLVEV